MGRAVRQFEKEVSFKLGKEVENVTSSCMGRAVRQFEKEVSFWQVSHCGLFIFMSRHMLSHKYVTTFTPRESWRSHVWDINDI